MNLLDNILNRNLDIIKNKKKKYYQKNQSSNINKFITNNINKQTIKLQ